jgi:uncharacterized membrane protein YedE/YeeE
MVGKPMHDEPSRKRRLLAIAALLGLAFGFLLQKGGVAKYHVLMGVLLLEDWTVVQVMLTAIAVGALGIHVLHTLGRAEWKLEPTRLFANVLGSTLFGIGFGLNGYCPGTQAAALGQGNVDALAGVAGMLAGSWVFAELSGTLKRFGRIGDKGRRSLPSLASVSRTAFLVVFLPGIVLVLVALERIGGR